jgi:hypothetical protein
MQPFAVDLARFFAVDLDAAREYVAASTAPTAGSRTPPASACSALNLGADPRVLEDSSDVRRPTPTTPS